MAIYLGNLNIREIEQKIGMELPLELKQYLDDKHQKEAENIQKGKWHCFDIPFIFVCGDFDMAMIVAKHLNPIADSFKKKMQLGYN